MLALTATPLGLRIECVKVPYLSRINEKKAIQRAAGAAAFSFQKPDWCSRHFISLDLGKWQKPCGKFAKIFLFVLKNARFFTENRRLFVRKPFFSGGGLKKKNWGPFLFWEHLCLVSLTSKVVSSTPPLLIKYSIVVRFEALKKHFGFLSQGPSLYQLDT